MDSMWKRADVKQLRRISQNKILAVLCRCGTLCCDTRPPLRYFNIPRKYRHVHRVLSYFAIICPIYRQKLKKKSNEKGAKGHRQASETSRAEDIYGKRTKVQKTRSCGTRGSGGVVVVAVVVLLVSERGTARGFQTINSSQRSEGGPGERQNSATKGSTRGTATRSRPSDEVGAHRNRAGRDREKRGQRCGELCHTEKGARKCLLVKGCQAIAYTTGATIRAQLYIPPQLLGHRQHEYTGPGGSVVL